MRGAQHVNILRQADLLATRSGAHDAAGGVLPPPRPRPPRRPRRRRGAGADASASGAGGAACCRPTSASAAWRSAERRLLLRFGVATSGVAPDTSMGRVPDRPLRRRGVAPRSAATSATRRRTRAGSDATVFAASRAAPTAAAAPPRLVLVSL